MIAKVRSAAALEVLRRSLSPDRAWITGHTEIVLLDADLCPDADNTPGVASGGVTHN